MSVDIPRAWEIARGVAPQRHPDPKCSFRQTAGALLCDCAVLMKHPEYLDDLLQTSDGVVLTAEALRPLRARP